MRVLAVADKESAYYYDFYTPGKLSEFDLILACGDLRREYLEFLATLARCPVVYVRGNHNDSFLETQGPRQRSGRFRRAVPYACASRGE